ncbi:uncharacterized protein K460DRAFT_394123 [Cucurbitaria berberidis CBS 394.84]|uniref:Uncharacterized protein n=1 Tax=Cucurbitaria berberidis CBS 394.84 TaxID=1168544 RepID=A0A9P4GPY5_9PLEO|nr:uncharacterized protein K460DRAFT_394123 [Cucurbitaria berberidis CBS 394.84]KAF1849256.1 hypothetical protein K460DRAFT_394123 [Cucurbitaria berberidis CBS 394.84]
MILLFWEALEFLLLFQSFEVESICFTKTVGAYQTVKSPIWCSQNPYRSFERSKFSGVNDTAIEKWYFEAVSEAGDAFIVSLGRDPSYKPFGFGVIPFEMMFVFANGTRHAMSDFASESRIRDCCGEVDLKVQGSRLKFAGTGGHFHDFAAFDWFTLLDSWRNMRAIIGPYAFSLCIPVSRIAGRIVYPSGVLYKDGKPMLEVYGLDNDTLLASNRLLIHPHFDGTFTGGLGDTSSSWIVEFAEPASSRRWRFTSKHQALVHELGLGSGSGLSVFTDLIEGGELNSWQHSGYGISEQITAPKSIGPSVAWELFKTHRNNTGSTTWQAVWNMFCAACRDGALTVSWIMFRNGWTVEFNKVS